MAVTDIVILIIIGAGIVMGLMRGLIKQACAVVGLIAGLLVARALYGMVGEQLAPHIGTSVSVAQIIVCGDMGGGADYPDGCGYGAD